MPVDRRNPAPSPSSRDATLSDPVERTHWPAVAVAIAAGVVAAFHVGKLPSALPALRAELGLSLVAAGWVASTFNTVGTFGALPLGIASTRVGRFGIVAFGVVLLAAGGIAGAWAETTAGLLVSRAVEGAGFLAVVVGAPALIVAASAAPDRALALGWWSTYMPVGAALMLVVTPPALALVGWRGLWLMNVLATGALLLALVRLRPHYAAAGSIGSGSLAGSTRTLGRLGLWLLGLAFALYTAQWITLMTWMPTYLITSGALSPASAAFATAFVVAWNVPGNLLGAALLRRGVAFGTIIAVASAVMGGCILSIFSEAIPWPVRVGAYVVFSCAGGMLPAAVLSGAPRFAARPDHIALTSGVVVQGSNIGQFVGPPLAAGIVAATGSWMASIPFLTGCAAVGVACGLVLRRSAVLAGGR